MKYEVISPSAIENANYAMLFVLCYKYDKFGCEYVVEKGRITEIHEKDKIIKES